MPCTPTQLPDAGMAIVCTRGRRSLRKYRCFCNLAGGFQCDWKVGDGKTCDAYLCPDHATAVGDNKHLCPTHVEAWEKWKLDQQEKERSVRTDAENWAIQVIINPDDPAGTQMRRDAALRKLIADCRDATGAKNMEINVPHRWIIGAGDEVLVASFPTAVERSEG